MRSNIYTRRVLAGEFQVVNPWLLRDLVDHGLWDDAMKNTIIAHNGSIQNVAGIPDELKRIYKTVWEISQKVIIDLSADRGAFIDQSQSLNIHLSSPTMAQLTSMHFYGWKKGLKTGMVRLEHPLTCGGAKQSSLTDVPVSARCSTTCGRVLLLAPSSSRSMQRP